MAPNRKQVKQEGITDSSQTDPEFELAINSAQHIQLDLDKEKNRHAKEMKELDLGKVGWLIGDGKNAASSIAAVCAIFGLLGFTICLYNAGTTEQIEFWSRNAERSLGVSLTALAFMFGKSAGSTK